MTGSKDILILRGKEYYLIGTTELFKPIDLSWFENNWLNWINKWFDIFSYELLIYKWVMIDR
jgi:hypothetical protein